MDHFQYRDRTLFCEDVPVPAIVAKFGTPVFVYSKATLLHHLKSIQSAFAEAKPVIAYSVKTNGNLALCKLMAENGSGFDVTSGGELYRALKAGGPGVKTVFAGVGKSEAEMRFGLESNVMLFNVESEEELFELGRVAASMGRKAPVALRVNPDLPPKTHAKTDTSVKGVKFGLDIEGVLDVSAKAVGHPGLAIVGLHLHLGSPILKSEPYAAGAAKAVQLIEAFRKQGHDIRYLNMGGGFGIHYRKQEALPATALPTMNRPGSRTSWHPVARTAGRMTSANAVAGKASCLR